MEEKKVVAEEAATELNDEELSGISGGRKYPIPMDDDIPQTSVLYDPVPEVPKDLDPSLLHW